MAPATRTAERAGSARVGGRGFAMRDAMALIAGCGIAAAVMLAMSCQSSGKPGDSPAMTASRSVSQQLKCATQVRGMGQAMIIFANNNRDQYPLPSTLDPRNQTVSEPGRAKDTTANIYSILIWNGMISPELCVCTEEHSKRIEVCTTYEYTAPRVGAVPANALWDPAFSADFTKGKGNTSYAHQQPSGGWADSGQKDKDGKSIMVGTGRLATWSNTFMSSEAVLGDRGPQMTDVTFDNPKDVSTARVKLARSDSITFLNHGAPNSWEGHIAYNDNHVNLETSLAPPAPPAYVNTYKNAAGEQRFDTWFYDEPDDAARRNIFLGIFVKAGATPQEFRPIWD